MGLNYGKKSDCKLLISWRIEEIFPRFVKRMSDKTLLTYNRHFYSLGWGVGIFHQILQHHIGLQLLVGLLTMLGNDLPFQPLICFSGNLLVYNFVSHVWQLLFEGQLRFIRILTCCVAFLKNPPGRAVEVCLALYH